MKARFPGRCKACSQTWETGAQIRPTSNGWAHQRCAEFLAETERIEQGLTFAGTRAAFKRRHARTP